MNTDIKSFVLLKYEILTSNQNTWDRCCETYPESVKSKWAWRCAADVEHLAKGYKEAEECIRVAKLCRDGLATKEELNKVWDATHATTHATRAAYAATFAGAAYAATFAGAASAAYAAYYAAYATYAGQRDEKWKLYISWLIEELSEYEANQPITA